MSELPAPRNVAKVEEAPRLESRPSRTEVIRSINRTLDGVPGVPGYREEMAPLWDRLKRGDNLTPQERRDAIGYHVTMEGIKNITGREPQPGEPSWPDNLATDEWTNEYKDENGNVVGKQREGLRIKHLTDWLDRKIKQAQSDGRAKDEFMFKASKADLEASSAPYSKLHSSEGSIDIETRKRQEAGAWIHASEEMDSQDRRVRDSQIPQDNETNRAAHEREDWMFASEELDGPNGEQGGALELVVPPPPTPEIPRLANVPTLRVDENLPTKRVEVPGNDGLPPVYVSEEGSGSGGTVDMGGGEIVPPPGEIVRTGVDVAPRTIPENLRSSGRSESSRPGDFAVSDEVSGGSEGVGGVGDDRLSADRDAFGEALDEALDSSGVDRNLPPGLNPSSPDFRFGMPPAGDVSGGFYPEGDSRRERESTEGSESTEGPEDAAEKEAGARSERLAKTGLARKLWDRARDFVGRSAPDDDWLAPRVDAPLRPGYSGKRVGRWIALALVVAAVVATCARPGAGGPQASSGAEPFPGNQYPKMEQVVNRPQMTTPAPAEEAAAVIAPEQNQPAASSAEVKPAGGIEGGGGRSISSSEHDFSFAGEKQSLKGVTEDQLAQLLSPEYKAYVDKMKSEGEAVDAEEGGSKDILDKFKTKLIGQFGDQEGQLKYDTIISNLTEQQRYVLENLNGPGGSKVGIGADRDAIIRGPEWNGKLNLVDMSKDSDGFMTVIKGITGRGGYSSSDAGVLEQYTVGFNSGGNP